MQKEIKFIVSDLDDTLLNDELQISDYTRQVILNAQKKGILIAIASGRPTPSILPYAYALELHRYQGYVIGFNGATTFDCASQKEIARTPLTWENIDTIIEIARQKQLFIHSYVNGCIVTPKMNEYTDFEGELTGMPVIQVNNIREVMHEEVVKIILLEKPERIKQVAAELAPKVHQHISMSISKPFFLEFTSVQVDKYSSTRHIGCLLGITNDQIMAIGDSYNDLSMITGCGIGIVMNNGPKEVKEHAFHITHCNNTDGVATAINRFALAI